MLSSAYAIFGEFQTKISALSRFDAVQALLKETNQTLGVEISPSGIWVAHWDIGEQNLSGVLDFRCTIKWSCPEGERSWLTSFRMEDPKGMTLEEWQERLFALIKEEILRQR